MIDEIASARVNRYGVPPCLRVPIAAVDEAAIVRHVGTVAQVLSGKRSRRALLIEAHAPPLIDPTLAIWDEPGASMLYRPLQVWVHSRYSRYVAAYRKAFPDAIVGNGIVLSHAMNRRLAEHKGFAFVRVTPTSVAANSSSAFSEGWAVARHSELRQVAANPASGMGVQYADLTDLMLMLDARLGGGVMDAVNEGQKLIRPRL